MPEQFLIDHCSPTLAGLKTANMFPVSLDEEQDIDAEVRILNSLIPKEQEEENEQHLHLRGSFYSGFPAVRAEKEAAENVTEHTKLTLNDELVIRNNSEHGTCRHALGWEVFLFNPLFSSEALMSEISYVDHAIPNMVD